jgi:diaminohydroxyphosphoribosylaminopyrimidine deaminase / 5-amino-6-(5-phosphoribosylamino)uracil reductase
MSDAHFMRLAVHLGQRGYGTTSPNPMVGAVLVKQGQIIGQGWHRRAGEPHAEVEAFRDAQAHGHNASGATLYVTLEPCSTQGRTPPCTDAIIATGIKRVVIGATDPNPAHAGRAFRILEQAGILVARAVLANVCEQLNEAFNHWIVHQTPFVTVKAAMTLDGKIATTAGESKWITSEKARAYGMKLRRGADAILVGSNTVMADDPSLTLRDKGLERQNVEHPASNAQHPKLRRIVLDSMARTPLNAKVVTDEQAALTTIVVSKAAPRSRVTALCERVNVVVAPTTRNDSGTTCHGSRVDLRWLLKKLGAENVTSLLVEGGGEVNASFLLGGFAHRVVFFYAPKILGGRDARRAVAGDGIERVADAIKLHDVEWRRLGPDLHLTARLESKL